MHINKRGFRIADFEIILRQFKKGVAVIWTPKALTENTCEQFRNTTRSIYSPKNRKLQTNIKDREEMLPEPDLL